jgi:hypothetical protein
MINGVRYWTRQIQHRKWKQLPKDPHAILLAFNEEPALARLRELTELERTPLPLPKF